MEQPHDCLSPPPEGSVPACPYHHAAYALPPGPDDDMSLAGMGRVLVRQWKVVATCAIFAVVAAAAYLLVAAPTYQAKVVALPPRSSHVEALNVPSVHSTTAEEVYAMFVRNLKSNALRRQFFDEAGLFTVLGRDKTDSEERVFQDEFNTRLKVKDGTRDQQETILVTLEGTQAQDVTEWLNEFVDLVARSTIDEIIDGVQRRMANRQEGIRKSIEISRQLAKEQREDQIAALEEKLAIIRKGERRQDRIVLLDEQIAIARELNIVDRADASLRASEGQSVALNVNTAYEPLYLRGVTELLAEKEALEKREDDDPFLPIRDLVAELEVLRARTNDDPFIRNLRNREEELARLDAALAQFEGSTSAVLPARIDQRAYVPEWPVSPKRSRILPLALVAGLLAGSLAAFQVNALTPLKA